MHAKKNRSVWLDAAIERNSTDIIDTAYYLCIPFRRNNYGFIRRFSVERLENTHKIATIENVDPSAGYE